MLAVCGVVPVAAVVPFCLAKHTATTQRDPYYCNPFIAAPTFVGTNYLKIVCVCVFFLAEDGLRPIGVTDTHKMDYAPNDLSLGGCWGCKCGFLAGRVVMAHASVLGCQPRDWCKYALLVCAVGMLNGECLLLLP